ncbi:hypothetical protein IEQ34_004252 [Dendrobium chrysotoxum]|uniref:Uncharacterized protein n=1 Tax=Dendrobium chrysotoxum TaxID=161865 RepID=A0AAV7HGT8_DENCH|nr:hypothetical protein IEQ34_004252 [Dendrobium chrysotoxum]
MARAVDPSNGTRNLGKYYYEMLQSLFEIDTKYVPIKPIGFNQKNYNIFENRLDVLRTLREVKLLCHPHHENAITLKI